MEEGVRNPLNTALQPCGRQGRAMAAEGLVGFFDLLVNGRG